MPSILPGIRATLARFRPTRGAASRSHRDFHPDCQFLEGRQMLSVTIQPTDAVAGQVLAAGASAPRPSSPSPSQIQTAAARGQARREAYLATVQRVLAEFHAPGAVAGVWVPGQRPWVTAQGVANVETGQSISIDDRFPIRSITKSFTVTRILQLARERRLSLNDPISDYVEGIPNGDQITLAQLAGMNSGVKNYTQAPRFIEQFAGDFTRPWTPREIVDTTIPDSPVFAPGTQYNYSNTNTILLGMVVEQVTARPIAATFQTRILNPLRMKDTSYPNDASIPSPHPTPYLVDPATGDLEEAPAVNLSSLGAAGGLVSSIQDLRRWGVALGTGRLVGPRLHRLSERLTRPATDGPEYDRYGLGIGELKGWWGHSGEALGFQAAVFYQPRTRAVIAVALNSSQSTHVAVEIFKALADKVGGRFRAG